MKLVMKKSLWNKPYCIILGGPPTPQIAEKGFEWVNEGSKWSYKVSECNETYVANGY